MNPILGIGVDIEEIQRISSIIQKWDHLFINRIFTISEIQYCENKNKPAQHFAARYAAKEAFSKAIGTGWSGKFRWKDTEIQNDIAGKPLFILHNHLHEAFYEMDIFLSLSHTRSHVVAMVVIQNSNQKF